MSEAQRRIGPLLVGLWAAACVLDNPEFGAWSGGEATAATGTASASAGPTTGAGTTSASTTSGGGGSGSGGEVSGTSEATTSGDATSGGESTGASASSSSSTGDLPCADADKIPLYVDMDMDGYGVEPAVMMVCPGDLPVPGHAPAVGDCDDLNPQRTPDKVEVCDMIDNDCNGLIDEAAEGLAACILGGCHRATVGGHFYYACAQATQLDKANALCKGLAVPDSGASAYHVKIESMAENEVAAGLAAAVGGDTSIGLRDTGNLDFIGDYKWAADDSKLEGFGAGFKAYPWQSSQPDGPFIEDWIVLKATNEGWVWNDTETSKQLPFICEGVPAP